VTQHVPSYLVPANAAKGSAVLILPAFCPDCRELTMEIVERRANDSYKARCMACGCQTFGKISPELLITKRGVDTPR
jgi:hypothetical protein